MKFLLIVFGFIVLYYVVSFIINPANTKEALRKLLVTIKRKTYFIPLMFLFVSCFIFSTKMTHYSDCIAVVYAKGMGLCFFINTLCSMLAIITFVLAFPHREKPKMALIVIVVIMNIIIIASEIIIIKSINYALYIKENPIIISATNKLTLSILPTKRMAIIHIVLQSIALVSIVTLPIYKKYLQRINTSIKVNDGIIKDIKINTEE